MPRSQKRKPHTPVKHPEAQDTNQGPRDAKEEALGSSSPPPAEAVRQTKPATRSRSTVKSGGDSHTGLSEAAKGQTKKKPSSSKAPPSTVQSQTNTVSEVTGMLVQFLTQMYQRKQPIRKAAMLKIVTKKYKKCFCKILRGACSTMEMVFGLDLKKVEAAKHCYTLVSKMHLPNNGRVSHGNRGFSKTGLLMHILGMIFISSNCATEQKLWEFLNKMKIYAGKRHFLFGEPKKLITQDFVKLNYLEYRQVPDSDPPCHEFLWGPKAHAETSKMKVLEFWAKINHTVPSAFPSWYEEALQAEEGAQGPVPLSADAKAMQ